jgi:hypothetical protein
MFKYNTGDVVYKPLFQHDGTKTYMSYAVLDRFIENGQKKYKVNDLLTSVYTEEKLLTKEELIIFLNTGV